MRKDNGFTLVELVIALTIISITAVLAGPAIFNRLSPENRFKSTMSNLYSDIVFAQNEAIRQGGYNIVGGTLRARKVFVTFTAPNSYSIWRWEDTDGDNVVDAGEFDPDMAGGADAAIKTVTMGSPSQTTYGIPSYVNKSACSNGSSPSNAVNYTSGVLPPCGNCSYIEFDANGFADSFGEIYLTNSDNGFSYAIAGSRAGLFTMCKWDTSSNQWDWLPVH